MGYFNEAQTRARNDKKQIKQAEANSKGHVEPTPSDFGEVYGHLQISDVVRLSHLEVEENPEGEILHAPFKIA